MRTDSVKKYVIPNIPYLFILWACLKLGTAYRLAPGADFAHKLMGLGQSIGPAFADLIETAMVRLETSSSISRIPPFHEKSTSGQNVQKCRYRSSCSFAAIFR